MILKIDTIRTTLEEILVKKGVPAEEATIIADEYLQGELLGKISHGLQAFPSLVKKLGTLPKKWVVEKETEAMALIEGNGYFGQVIGKEAVRLACAKAKQQGIGFVAIKNMKTWLRPRTPARWIAEEGCVGIVLNNGGNPWWRRSVA
ncbi:MAG: Ldh family oxidoreductase [Nanoarchaeota archaeon]|nr:Ldh family oxidoreductase [Nanoarchaeota archaeon]